MSQSFNCYILCSPPQPRQVRDADCDGVADGQHRGGQSRRLAHRVRFVPAVGVKRGQVCGRQIHGQRGPSALHDAAIAAGANLYG
jgi:hypothetical protein